MDTTVAPPRLTGLNQGSRAAFVALLGGIFEHSPWVAEQAWPRRPFASVDALHRAMLDIVLGSGAAAQLALLRAHPQLAGAEAQAGALTAASEHEQAGAGLKALRRDELERITALNAAYEAKHGFPFIVCVRHYTKAGIFHELQRRLDLDTSREREEALAQVAAITRLRLQTLFPDD